MTRSQIALDGDVRPGLEARSITSKGSHPTKDSVNGLPRASPTLREP